MKATVVLKQCRMDDEATIDSVNEYLNVSIYYETSSLHK
jgi:hypothetical protein